jgi:hypothetical protein
LCDIAPDGASRLVSWGLLNLTHRDSHEQPALLEPGQIYQVTVRLNVVAHRLVPGHCWRLAISPTYWPHAWPSPEPVRLTLHTGSDCQLVLPIRPANRLDDALHDFGPAEGAALLEYEALRTESSSRTVTHDVTGRCLHLVDQVDEGRIRILSNGIVRDSVLTNSFSICEDQPLSAGVQCSRQIEISREDWQTRVETLSIMTSDHSQFHLTNILNAYEGQVRVFTKSWTRSIPRQFV